MVEQKKIEKLYSMVLKNCLITIDFFKQNNFSQEDIDYLIEKKYIIETDDNNYEFINYKKLYSYGKKVQFANNHKEALRIFEKCYKINKNDSKVWFQLFYYGVLNNDYDKAYKYLKMLLSDNNKFNYNNYYFYLYLLSEITKIDDVSLKITTYQDMKLRIDQNWKNADIHNKIRRYCLSKKYDEAYELINRYQSENQVLTIQENIIKIFIEKIMNNKKEEITITDIMNLLVSNNIKKAMDKIDKYLSDNRLLEYKKILLHLYKISLIKKDFLYTDVIMFLNDISKNNYIFEIDLYTRLFYENVKNNNIELASLYLDILADNPINVKLSIDKMKELLKNNKSIVVEENDKKENTDNNEKIVSETPIIKKEKITILESEKNDLLKHFNDIKKTKDIYLYDNLSNRQIEVIHRLAIKIDELIYYDLNYGNEKRIMLRYKPKKQEKIDVKSVLTEAKNDFKNKLYKNSLEKFKILLSIGEPFTYIYAMIGLCYMNLHDKKKAIDYLTIATYRSSKEDSKYDYTKQIDYLRGKEVDEKSYVKMEVIDFFKDPYEDIEGASEIVRSVVYKKENFEELLNEQYSQEEINIILLMIAKEYYKNEFYNQGDIYLKIVSGKKDKTKKINLLINDIRKNKKFYKNRKNKELVRK